jgi:hypothetical protein
MLASIPASMVNQKPADLGIPNRFNLNSFRFSGRKLATLRDAALYITKLPKAEHDAEEWQAAMQALLLVAEYDGPTIFACR